MVPVCEVEVESLELPMRYEAEVEAIGSEGTDRDGGVPLFAYGGDLNREEDGVSGK